MIRIFAIFTIFLATNVWGFDHSHKTFDQLLQDHVVVKDRQSMVSYQTIQKDKNLDKYLKELSSLSKKEFDGFSPNEQLALLINAYNAFTIKLVIDHYPVKSIKDIGPFFISPWKKKFITFLGEITNLDNIEHNLIRTHFKEPRTHFAINCASVGCPSLMKTAFIASRLEDQLDNAAKLFFRNYKKNHINGNTLFLSKILKWYGEDFKVKFGSLEHFVAPYLTDDKATVMKIQAGEYDIEFLDYDWSLNDADS